MCLSNHIIDTLRKLALSKTIIFCIGNTLKSDDGAGPALYDLIKNKIPVDIINAGNAPENYIQSIIALKPQNLIIVDALDFSAKPGKIEFFDLNQISSFASSTHSLSLHFFTSIISNDIATNVHVIGIQPQTVEIGTELTPDVKKAVAKLTDIILDIFSKPVASDNFS